MSKRNKIMFNKPDEPAFIKRLKAAAGYVEGPDINAKRASQSMDEREDRDDCDDEKPTVVVLNSGDLTAEEVDALSAAADKAEEDDVPPDGKIVFKKPSKKSSANNPLLKASTASPVPARESEKSSEKTLKDKPSRKDTKRQKALLSFNEEDEDS